MQLDQLLNPTLIQLPQRLIRSPQPRLKAAAMTLVAHSIFAETQSIDRGSLGRAADSTHKSHVDLIGHGMVYRDENTQLKRPLPI